jgi:hypothetical protein
MISTAIQCVHVKGKKVEKKKANRRESDGH